MVTPLNRLSINSFMHYLEKWQWSIIVLLIGSTLFSHLTNWLSAYHRPGYLLGAGGTAKTQKDPDFAPREIPGASNNHINKNKNTVNRRGQGLMRILLDRTRCCRRFPF